MGCGVSGGARWQLAACVLLIVAVAGCSGEASDGSAFSAGGAGGVGTAGSSGTGGAVGGTGGQFIEPPSGSIPTFVAQGHAGRTIISCDDGRTWVADGSDEEWNYCSNNDCDHGSGAGRGITRGDGWFFATFGWGSPGSLRRSRDGVSWEPVLDGETFGGVVYGNARLVAASRNGQYSDDHGYTWRDFGSVALTTWNVRDAAFVPYDGGRFIMTAHDDVSEIVVSTDGVSWTQPQSAPSDCGGGSYQGRIVYGNGTIVMTGNGGIICYSKDGGQTWASKSIAESLRANGIWNGDEFMTWNYGTLYRSTDGQTWTTTETVPGDIDIGVTAVSEEGTIVGVTNGWQQHYDSQVFYRSEDGVHWEVLARDAYTGGHPIKVIAFGYGAPSQHCALTTNADFAR